MRWEKRRACEVVEQREMERRGINTVMESERKGVRGGGAERWFLSNPLDTRSVWLHTGSERLVEGVQAGTERKDEGKAREICCSPLLLTEIKGGREDPETCMFFGWGWKKIEVRMLLQPNSAWDKPAKKKEKLKKSWKREKKKGQWRRNDGGAENVQRCWSLFSQAHMDLRVTTRCCQRGEAWGCTVGTQVMDVCLHKPLRDAREK